MPFSDKCPLTRVLKFSPVWKWVVNSFPLLRKHENNGTFPSNPSPGKFKNQLVVMTSSLRAETDALLTVIQNRVAVATGRAPDTGDRKSRTINRSRVGRHKRGARGRVTGKRRVRRRTGSRRARARRTEPDRPRPRLRRTRRGASDQSDFGRWLLRSCDGAVSNAV